MTLAAIGQFYGCRCARHWALLAGGSGGGALVWFAGNATASRSPAAWSLPCKMALGRHAAAHPPRSPWIGLRLVMAARRLPAVRCCCCTVAMLPRIRHCAGILSPSPQQDRLFLLGYVFRMVFAFGFLLLSRRSATKKFAPSGDARPAHRSPQSPQLLRVGRTGTGAPSSQRASR